MTDAKLPVDVSLQLIESVHHRMVVMLRSLSNEQICPQIPAPAGSG